MYYFLRVNGDTLHNNPNNSKYYVPDEPPRYPKTYFDYLNYCLNKNIIRIGWPDTGDLHRPSKSGALSNGYALEDLKPYEQKYLRSFAAIQQGDVVLVPDKSNPGNLYIATVSGPYQYHHDVPLDPYECSHRFPVEWDRYADGTPIRYHATEMNINPQYGLWMRAFRVLDEIPSGRAAIPFIEAVRAAKRA